MRDRLRDMGHLLRLAGLFAAGGGLFALLSLVMVPDDFGQLGHYRTGALADNRLPELVHADGATCGDCHDDVVAIRRGSRHERVACQACHGPLAAHAADPAASMPVRPDPARLCLGCHARLIGRPTDFPQVEPVEHAGDQPCAACHQPHHPEPEGA